MKRKRPSRKAAHPEQVSAVEGIRQGLESMRRGRGIPADVFFARLKARLLRAKRSRPCSPRHDIEGDP